MQSCVAVNIVIDGVDVSGESVSDNNFFESAPKDYL